MQRHNTKNWTKNRESIKQAGEGLKDLEVIRNPSGDQYSQIIWALGGSQKLNHQSAWAGQPPPSTPRKYEADENLGLQVDPSPNNWSWGCRLHFCLTVDPVARTGLPFLTSVGKDESGSWVIWCTSVDGTQDCTPHSQRKRTGKISVGNLCKGVWKDVDLWSWIPEVKWKDN